MIFAKNISEIAQDYDHFILDIWGVIHDGQAPYPHVIENLKKLRKLGKKIYFLSNAPRRASVVADILKKFGITGDFHDLVMSSGEASYLFLEDNQNNNFADFGKNYYYIGPQKDIGLLDGLEYKMVKDVSIADFVITTGFDHDLSILEEKLPELENSLKHNLPMICVNPDLIVVRQNGQEMLCAGIIAQQYKKMGGEITYFGKPYDLVYKKIFQLCNLDSKSKIIAVGDGIETDILGANNNDLDSALIGGGILSNRLNIKYGQLPQENDIKEICQEYNIHPKFIIAGL